MRNRIKNICLLIGVVFLSFTNVTAQSIDSDFYFVYIAHDRATPVQRLSRLLQDLYDDAVKYGHSCVFYLANNESPYVVNINTENDNRNDFAPQIIGELQSKISHGINPRFDVDSIVNLFNANDYLLSREKLRYTSVTWRFYTSEWFWHERYNESLIASLYWIMDVDKIQNLEFYFSVYHSRDDNLDLDSESVFGKKNPSNINADCFLLKY